MKHYLKIFDKSLSRCLQVISRLAEKEGVEAFIVGGIVRDAILKQVNLDLDIVVVGHAPSLASRVAQYYKGDRRAHKSFETATVSLPNGLTIDFATARKETYPHPGALPVVSKGSLPEDLQRRDFSINTMAISINQSSRGDLIDVCGGRTDLEKRTIRVLHDLSFQDDPTRLLRAIRFEQRFGFSIDSHTLRLFKKAIREKGYLHVKAPRLFNEFKKILKEERPFKYLKRLKFLRLLHVFIGKTQVSWVALQEAEKRIIRLRTKPFFSAFDGWWLVYWLILLEKIKRSTLSQIMVKFPFKKLERQTLEQIAEMKPSLAKLSLPRVSRSEVYRILKPLNPTIVYGMCVRSSQLRTRRRIEQFLLFDQDVRSTLQGNDLKKMGLAPSKKMRDIFEQIIYQRIDGHIKTKSQEMKLAKALIKK